MHKDNRILSIEEREQLENYETGKLIAELIKYTHSLQTMVVDLRKEVNRLDPHTPYCDLHSDLYQPFEEEDYPTLGRLQEYIEPHFIHIENDEDYL